MGSTNIDQEVISNADSKGVILDYFTTQAPVRQEGIMGRSPRTQPSVILKILRNDPVVRSSIIKLVDKANESGWRLQPINGNKKSSMKALEQELKRVRFNRLLRKVMFNLIMYNNAFVEIRKKGSKLSELNILETEYMKIDADDNGNVLGYYQEIGADSSFDKSAKRPSWEVDEVTHFKLDDFTTNVWSEFNIEAIYETVLIKDYARQIMQWFVQTNQMRPIIAVEESSTQKMKEFMAYLKAAEYHLGKPIPVEGKIVVGPLQDPSKIIPYLLQIIAWANSEIRQLLQVPEIAAGISDSSGRNVGAEAREYINTRVFNIHSLLEDDITYDLLPKSGFDRVEFVFGIMDETVRTRIFETTMTMRNAQFTPEAILEYLADQGVVFETSKPLLSQEDIAAMSNKDLGTGNEGMAGKKSADAAPSRARQNGQDLSKANRQTKQA
jgi:hypothetical protein